MCTVKFIHSFIHSWVPPGFLGFAIAEIEDCKKSRKLRNIPKSLQIHAREYRKSHLPTDITAKTISYHRDIANSISARKKKKNSFRKGSQQNQAFFAATSPVRTDFLLAADWQTITSWWTHFWCTIYSIRYDIYATSPTPTSPNFPGFSALYLSFRENL